MSQFGRFPHFRPFWVATRAKFGSLVSGTATDQGAGSGNFQTLYQNNARTPQIETRVDSGATVTPTASDHGKTILTTNAGATTLNLPAISAVFDGYRFTVINGCGGSTAGSPRGNVVTVNRNGTDTIDPSATTFAIIAAGGLNRQTLQVINGKWYTLEPRWGMTQGTALTASTRHSIAHNLGAAPQPGNVTPMLRCNTIDLGYEVDDVIVLNPSAIQSTAAAAFNIQLQTDSTNILVDLGANALYINREDTFGNGVVTLGSWDFQSLYFY